MAYFQKRLPCYAPQHVVVQTSFSKTFDKQTTSTQFSIKNINGIYSFIHQESQSLKLEPVMLGQFVRIELIGKRQRQPGAPYVYTGDEKYYTCIDSLQIYGCLFHALMKTPVIRQTLDIWLTQKKIKAGMGNPNDDEYNETNTINRYTRHEKDLGDLRAALHFIEDHKFNDFIELAVTCDIDSIVRQPEMLDLLETHFHSITPYFKKLIDASKPLTIPESIMLGLVN